MSAPAYPNKSAVQGSKSVSSPCVRNCCLDTQNMCLGCGRLLEEILAWNTTDARHQQHILALAKQRLSANNPDRR